MYTEDILKIVENYPNPHSWHNNSILDKQYGKQLKDSTPFLPPDSKLSERLYCIQHNIIIRTTCNNCKGMVNFSYSKGYNKYCSHKCYLACRDESKANEVRKHTCMKKYGVNSPMKTDNIKAKRESTFIKRYGVKGPFVFQIL